MTRSLLAVALPTLASALAACASADGDAVRLGLDDPRVGERLDRVCFNRQINGFSEWDEGEGLVLRRGSREEVLLTLPACPAADFARRVGVDERFGAGCLRPGDRVIVSSSATFGRLGGGAGGADPFATDACLIDGIYAYDRDADADPDAGAGAPGDEASP